MNLRMGRSRRWRRFRLVLGLEEGEERTRCLVGFVSSFSFFQSALTSAAAAAVVVAWEAEHIVALQAQAQAEHHNLCLFLV